MTKRARVGAGWQCSDDGDVCVGGATAGAHPTNPIVSLLLRVRSTTRLRGRSCSKADEGADGLLGFGGCDDTVCIVTAAAPIVPPPPVTHVRSLLYSERISTFMDAHVLRAALQMLSSVVTVAVVLLVFFTTAAETAVRGWQVYDTLLAKYRAVCAAWCML